MNAHRRVNRYGWSRDLAAPGILAIEAAFWATAGSRDCRTPSFVAQRPRRKLSPWTTHSSSTPRGPTTSTLPPCGFVFSAATRFCGDSTGSMNRQDRTRNREERCPGVVTSDPRPGLSDQRIPKRMVASDQVLGDALLWRKPMAQQPQCPLPGGCFRSRHRHNHTKPGKDRG